MVSLLPLVDTHCHLLAGLDDGPRTWDDAIRMCRIAWDDGVRAMAALAHQSERYPDNTPERIRAATRELASRLRMEEIPMSVYPCAEVMVFPDIVHAWRSGDLLGMADASRYLLIELPNNVFVELREMVSELVDEGVRPILAHPERQPELLNGDEVLEELILRGCLVQVSAASITQKTRPEFAERLRSWARRGMIHLVGSDGHSVVRRPPGIAAAFRQLANWIGPGPAERICSTNGMAVLEGLPLVAARPRPGVRGWFSKLSRVLSTGY